MTESTGVMVLPDKLIQQFAQMVTVIDDYEPGGGEGIIEAILTARTLVDLDAPWTGGRAAPVGQPLFIHKISKAPSDFPGGLPFYLVVEHIMPVSGEVKEYSVGSTAVVAQLVKAHTLGELPIAGSLVEKESKRNPGMKAQHFMVDLETTQWLREQLAATKTKK